MHPPITIAMASYNGARFIRAQLDSIAQQSVTNWRLVVSDDGSTDATRQIVTDFASAVPQLSGGLFVFRTLYLAGLSVTVSAPVKCRV